MSNKTSVKETCCAPICCDGKKQTEINNANQGTEQAVTNNSFRASIREVYKKVANLNKGNENNESPLSCCGSVNDANLHAQISTRLGYSQADLDIVPEGADMGVGCGNPRAIANLKIGETVVDLGSGGGFDCFLASPEVGETGQVIGIDMTADMISKARVNASSGNFSNVEFRLGEIENLPIADDSADVIISNCVINLSPDKAQVFREAHRILKSGGRLAISDVVSTRKVPDEIRDDPMLVAGCMGNTSLIDDIEKELQTAGFTKIDIQLKEESREFIRDWAPGTGAEDYVVAATIEAIKP